MGLVYYFWENKIKIDSVNDLNLKNEIKAKIGNFKINGNKVIQNLEIYKLEDKKFVKNNL